MKANRCEKCRKRKATVYLTVIGVTAEPSRHCYCDLCYRKIQEERAGSHAGTAEPSAALPPATEKLTSPQKPKRVGESRRRKCQTGLRIRCARCGTETPQEALDGNLRVCPECQFHFYIGARERVGWLVERDAFEELDADLAGADLLQFPGRAAYLSQLKECRRATGLNDAVITGVGRIGEHRAGLGALDFQFLGGSMGAAVGEKLTRLIERSTEQALPVILISASGGARMREGTLSLMQMAKTCGALARHSQAGLPCISVLTDPTMAGVLASFAGVGSLILAEPGARIGFAGPEVIKAITRAKLPPGFQTAEFLLEHGLIDAIVPRRELKPRLMDYLNFMTVRPSAAHKAALM